MHHQKIIDSHVHTMPIFGSSNAALNVALQTNLAVSDWNHRFSVGYGKRVARLCGGPHDLVSAWIECRIYLDFQCQRVPRTQMHMRLINEVEHYSTIVAWIKLASGERVPERVRDLQY